MNTDFYQDFDEPQEFIETAQRTQPIRDYKPKNLVGSIHAGTMNYYREVKAFDYEQIPSEVRQIASDVKNTTKPNILNTKQPDWNKSTYVEFTKPYEEHAQFPKKLFEIRAGLRDEAIPPQKPNVVYAGTETRDDYTGWNVSTEVSRRELNKKVGELTKTAMEKTKKEAERVTKDKTYVKPVQIQQQLTQTMRQDKMQDKELRQKFREEYVYANPKASEQKIAANVSKMVEMHKLKLKQAELAGQISMDETFKPNLKKTVKTRKVKEYSHDGAWVQSALTGGEAWSCCMNEDYNSPGCCVKVKDLDKWQFLSM